MNILNAIRKTHDTFMMEHMEVSAITAKKVALRGEGEETPLWY
ncbi:hypothetical protein [Mesorhizobium sp. PAMC28654]|nr:hypothetical protein [Mesorhizobium sp. PAMC28654]